MRIRRVTRADITPISRLYYETVHRVSARDYSPEQIRAWAPRVYPDAFWQRRFRLYRVPVAEDDGTIVGFVELGRTGKIDCFYVHHAHQHRVSAPPSWLGSNARPQVTAIPAWSLAQLTAGERWTVLSVTATSLEATVLLFVSIDRKNATMAGLIEISYPLFIVLFTWLLFREVHLSWISALGGVLIMAGAVIVIVSNR